MSRNVLKNTQIKMGTPYHLKISEEAFIHIDEDIEKKDYVEIEDTTEISEQDEEQISREIIRKAQQDADTLMKETEAKCAHMLDEAETKSIEIMQSARQQAYEQGYKEGCEKGYTEVINQYRDLINSISVIRDKADNEYNMLFERFESEIVELAFDIAKSVLNDELTADRSKLINIINEAISKCSNRESLILKVSGEDYDFIVNSADALYSSNGIGSNDIEIRKDPTLEKGSCVVESKLGIIDSGINTKLKKIREAFRQVSGADEQEVI